MNARGTRRPGGRGGSRPGGRGRGGASGCGMVAAPAFALILAALAAVVLASCQRSACSPATVPCPTEDSCTVDYYDGAYHIEPVTP